MKNHAIYCTKSAEGRKKCRCELINYECKREPQWMMPFSVPGAFQCCVKHSHYLNYLYLYKKYAPIILFHYDIKWKTSFSTLMVCLTRDSRESKERDWHIFIVTWNENLAQDTNYQTRIHCALLLSYALYIWVLIQGTRCSNDTKHLKWVLQLE